MTPACLALHTPGGRPGPGAVWAPQAKPCPCPTLTVPVLTGPQTLELRPSAETERAWAGPCLHHTEPRPGLGLSLALRVGGWDGATGAG